MLGALCAGSCTRRLPQSPPAEAQSAAAACPQNDSGLKLPAGFCATIFADGIGHARHLVVAPNGVVYVNTWSGPLLRQRHAARGRLPGRAARTPPARGRRTSISVSVRPCRAAARAAPASASTRAACSPKSTTRSYAMRCRRARSFRSGPAVPIVTGLPLGGDHPMHPFTIDSDGSLYIDVATATNACQVQNRTPKSPGIDPCTELETRGGIWRYDANKTNQAFSPAERFATGIRNAEGFAIDAAGHIFVTQHGRDQLHANWPDLYKPEEEATQPAEELLLLRQGGDYGWPECYYDAMQGKLVLAPEYGGDGGKKVGPCATKSAPIAAFPAHWAPNAMALYDKQQFPAHYRQRRVHRLSRIVGSSALPPRRLQRRVPSLGGRSRVGSVRDICRRICRRRGVAGPGRASSVRRGSRTRRLALRLRRCARTDLPHRLPRRIRR